MSLNGNKDICRILCEIEEVSFYDLVFVSLCAVSPTIPSQPSLGKERSLCF